jgi:hypothetical protein
MLSSGLLRCTPVEQVSLSFHLTLRDRESMTFEETDAFSAQFIRSLGLKVQSGCWSTIDLRSPRLEELIARSSELIQHGKAMFYGYNSLTFLPHDSETPAEWYQLIGNANIDLDDSRHGTQTSRAYQMARETHIASASGMLRNQYVSERFKAVVETNNLTGLEFLWLQDVGKYQAAQWYIPVATHPIGRGVDHPWFDSRTLKGSGSWQPRAARFRTGVWHFDSDQIKKDLRLKFPYPSLIGLYRACPDATLSIYSYRTYLRRSLPTTDFAFLWDQEDEMQNGRISKQRGLCANRKTVQLLLKSRLLNPNEIKPVRIIEKLRHHDEKLDGKAELPEPYYTEEELARVRKRLDSAWMRQTATAKPKRETTIKQALSMLRRAKKQRPADFRKPARSRKGPGVSLPAHWRAVLSVTGEGRVNDDCSIASITALPDMLLELDDSLKSLYDDYPFEYPHTPVGSGADGDIFSVEDRGSPQIDSKVFRLSHEGFTITYTWENIPLFISDMLSGFYD